MKFSLNCIFKKLLNSVWIVPQLSRDLDMSPRMPSRGHAGDCKVASDLDMVRPQTFVNCVLTCQEKFGSAAHMQWQFASQSYTAFRREFSPLPTPSTQGLRVWLGCEKLCRVLLCPGPRVSAHRSGVL